MEVVLRHQPTGSARVLFRISVFSFAPTRNIHPGSSEFKVPCLVGAPLVGARVEWAHEGCPYETRWSRLRRDGYDDSDGDRTCNPTPAGHSPTLGTLPHLDIGSFTREDEAFLTGCAPGQPTCRPRAMAERQFVICGAAEGQFVMHGWTICRASPRRLLRAGESLNLVSCGGLRGLSGYPQSNSMSWASALGNYVDRALGWICNESPFGKLAIPPRQLISNFATTAFRLTFLPVR
jgi:hypothetical protein